ncbi:uncharacterized protein ISCGN_002237 [Ixodes scapularis]
MFHKEFLKEALRICLGVPRAAASSLVVPEAHALKIPILRERETLRHFIRLLTRHHDHPLQMTLSVLSEAPDDVTTVYTDGSTSHLSSTAAFIIPSLNIEKKLLTFTQDKLN